MADAGAERDKSEPHRKKAKLKHDIAGDGLVKKAKAVEAKQAKQGAECGSFYC